MTHVLVVGAGYAGVTAANRIASRGAPDVRVTMVNPRADFVERIRLHQLAVDSGTATLPLTGLLHRDVALRVAAVADIGERSVTLDTGDSVTFDYLVYAVGSTTDTAGHDNVYSIGDLASAERLHDRLGALAPGAAVVVVGGGLTGIEAATEFAEQRPALQVRLISDAVGGWLPDRSRASIERALDRLGVTVHTGARVTRVGPGTVETADGAVFDSDCTVWAGAFAVPDLARRSGLPVDDRGRLLTDESLVCVGNPCIIGVGDAVAPPQHVAAHVRMSCQSAMPLGAHGADTVLALARGAAPKPLSFGFASQCVSLGRRDGLVQITTRDDTPRRFALRRRTAAAVKERICRYTLSAMRHAGRYRWPSGPEQSTRAAVPVG